MIQTLLKGTLVGGLIVFLWGMISWMALPFHQQSFSTFKNPDAVAQVLTENAPEQGIYLYPGWDTASQSDTVVKPSVFMAMAPDGMDPNNPKPFLFGLLTQLVGAFLITFLLMQVKPNAPYACRVKFVVLTALIGAFLSEMPMVNWWQFPMGHALLSMGDIIVGWTLAGLVLAKIVPSDGASCEVSS